MTTLFFLGHALFLFVCTGRELSQRTRGRTVLCAEQNACLGNFLDRSYTRVHLSCMVHQKEVMYYRHLNPVLALDTESITRVTS